MIQVHLNIQKHTDSVTESKLLKIYHKKTFVSPQKKKTQRRSTDTKNVNRRSADMEIPKEPEKVFRLISAVSAMKEANHILVSVFLGGLT